MLDMGVGPKAGGASRGRNTSSPTAEAQAVPLLRARTPRARAAGQPYD